MKSVRIAGGLGFYGDSWRPIKASIERGNVQYVASDHLAELTLAILQKDRQRDPNLGYTRDLVPMLSELLPIAIPRGVKFVLNAGGLNPMAAREMLLGALKKFGLKLKVGVVLGDSVQERLDELQAAGVSLAHMDTGEVISKAPGTGGRVNFDTLREQLLYEVHDPRHYITPDVDVDMTTLRMEEFGPDQVRVTGATGRPAPDMLKIVAGYEDGVMGQAMIGYAWPDALAKARAAAQIIQQQMVEIGLKSEETVIEYLGYNSIHGPLADPAHIDDLNEVYLRIAVRCADKKEAAKLGRLFPPLALSGPPFIGGAGGMMEPRGLLGIWLTLAPRALIEEYVRVSVEAT